MRDVLTEEECLQMAAQCWCEVETSKMNIDLHLAKAFAKRLQSAARLGAERERERAAKVAETPFSGEQDDITMQAKDRIAEAIRRGEEG